ncbi:hypothetical protein [Halodesulfovibrio spirochaetisodalis]|uniref:hypothetical protein n=1 Tax=Halodesulfovibrio spirochaetisodalis TaxID=1560234 RepID=UPI000836E307|nr:hypothetical protein [Halodesulfovibrio spirochaetisodalis]
MFNGFSREFLGETPTRRDKITIFSITFLLVGVVGYKSSPELAMLPMWKVILFLVTILDIFAGAIANFTKSSQIYYKNKPAKRIAFYFEHIIHIAFLVLTVGHMWYCVGLLAYTIAAGLFVNYTDSLKQQEINAAAVVCIGLVLFYVVVPVPQILVWLPSVFLVKLIFGFSIRRER